MAKNENPNQGAFIIEELTDLVEEAVLREFEAIASRGGVLGAMETGYQRSKIQDESTTCRPESTTAATHRRHQHVRSPQRPSRRSSRASCARPKRRRSSRRCCACARPEHAAEAGPALTRLKQAATRNAENLFAVLIGPNPPIWNISHSSTGTRARRSRGQNRPVFSPK